MADPARRTSERTPPRCPICNVQIDSSVETFPFCSKRCRLVDLGRWFRGRYGVSRPMAEDDEGL